MRYEIERVLHLPTLWFVITVSMGARCVLAVCDRIYRPESFWDLATSYFYLIGSLTLIMLILLVPIRLFTDDRYYFLEEIILTTNKGKFTLMVRRYIVCLLFGLLTAIFLSLGNYIISVIIFGSPPIDLTGYWYKTAQVALGGAGLAIAAGALCDMLQSHSMALFVCSLLTLFGFMIRGSMVEPFDFLWFFENGFFTSLLRGHAGATWKGWIGFWSLWHIILILLVLLFDIYKRKGRRAL
jgi:hypothetical protein